MKTTYLFILITCLYGLPSYSQQKERMIAKSSYYYSAGILNNADSDTYIYTDTFGSIHPDAYLYYGGYENNYLPVGFDQDVYVVLDAGAFQANSRTLNTYDSSHRLIDNTVQAFINNNWNDSIRNLYSYDADGNIIKRNKQSFNHLTNTWENIGADSSTYDLSHHLLTDSSYMSNPPYGTYRYAYYYSYNADGYPAEEIYTDIQGVTYYRNKYTHTYDSMNNPICMLELYEENGVWNYAAMDTWTYDNHHHMLSHSNYNWGNGYRQESNHNVYTYDTAGNQVTDTSYIEHSNSGLMYLSLIESKTYNNNRQTLIDKIANYDKGIYSYTEQYAYSYDTKGNINSLIISEGDSTEIPEEKYEMTYDDNNYLTHEADSKYDNGTWVAAADYYYRYNVLANTGSSAHTPLIYPNPAHDQFTIIFNAANTGTMPITLYDLTGRIVYTMQTEIQEGLNTYTCDVSGLPPGLYTYCIHTGALSDRGKIIVR